LRFGDISYMERRYRGSIEYRDTYGGVGIVVPISGIAQHYCNIHSKTNLAEQHRIYN